MTPWRATICVSAFLASGVFASADTVRVASFNVELHRNGPGLLLRDLERGGDQQIDAVVSVITRVSPDILALQGFDWDHDGKAIKAFAEQLAQSGVQFPYIFSLRPNSGMATDLDLDGDGRLGGPGDAQGYGSFSGQAGLAVLSRYPIRAEKALDLSHLLWRETPGAVLPAYEDGQPFPSAEAQSVQRLSSTAHWIVPVTLPNGQTLSLWTFHAAPPVFDGPEDRNGRRNHDEIELWRSVLDGYLNIKPGRFVIAGNANLDPFDGDGRHDAIRNLLSHPDIRDPAPQSPGAASAADQGHAGPNEQDTADWEGPGRLRVSYVLPDAEWQIAGSGVYWPTEDQDGYADALAASRHRLVWVDLILE